MDWRTGKPNSTGLAFRGISTRGRGRGRGRGGPPSGRGGYNNVPAAALPTPPPPAAATQEPTSLNLPPRPKSTSRRGSHQHSRRAPSLSQLDLSKTIVPSAEQQAVSSSPQISRPASNNPLGVSQNESHASKPQIPSVKLDPSTPTTPASPRARSGRKRSQNRRSSSKGSTQQDRLSATPSIASLREREKDTPPHLALASAPPNVQSFELRTNIDTLVERVRAMAMAGSAVDRDKDKEGHHTFNEGHIDWAGDDDDTLPDLDDWVRPKSAEPKQEDRATDNKASDKPVLSPVEETSLSLPSSEHGQEKKKEKTITSHSAKEVDKVQHAPEAKEIKEVKGTSEVNSAKEKASTSGRSKTRGRHGRKRGSGSGSLSAEANETTAEAKPFATDPAKQGVADSSILSVPKLRPPLVHPLPPKPQLAPSPTHGSRPRAPPQATLAAQPAIRLPEGTFQEVPPPPAAPPAEEKPVLAPPIEIIEPKPNVDVGNSGRSPQPTNKRPFDRTIDWANTPTTDATSSVNDGAHFPTSIESQSKNRTFDSNVDWANMSRSTHGSSPTRRSPTRGSPSPRRVRAFSPPAFPHSQTAPPHHRPRGLVPSFQNTSPPVFPTLSPDPSHPQQTRSQVNSPDSSPRRRLHRVGSNHFRSHSSPQTGPGTRTNTSRPVITLDAISRISRTLGVSQATTPPHSQIVGVTADE